MKSKKWKKFIIAINDVSGMYKYGFAGDDTLRVVFPWIIGRQKHISIMIELGQKDSYIQNETQSKRINMNW